MNLSDDEARLAKGVQILVGHGQAAFAAAFYILVEPFNVLRVGFLRTFHRGKLIADPVRGIEAETIRRRSRPSESVVLFMRSHPLIQYSAFQREVQ